jgi:hypothetical protein
MKAFFRPLVLAASLPALTFPSSAEEPVKAETFMTLGGFEVKSLSGNDPQIAKQGPDLPAPTRFNRGFDRAATTWRASEGYFVSFLSGETGGGLFFAEEKATAWEMLVDGRVEQVQRVGDKQYLATGGTMQMERMNGTVHLIAMDKAGKWQARKIYESHLGVPRIIGTAVLESAGGGGVPLTVIELDTKGAYPVDAIQGVTPDGVIHYLGRRLKEATAAVPAGVSDFWTSGSVHEVRAYLFDPDKGKTRSIIEDGKLHPGVANSPGAKVAPVRVEQLLRSLASNQNRSKFKLGAYGPHHGFVFYDKDGKVLAHVTICLACKDGMAYPQAAEANHWDIDMISIILNDSGVPVLASEEEYRRVFGEAPAAQNPPATPGEAQ